MIKRFLLSIDPLWYGLIFYFGGMLFFALLIAFIAVSAERPTIKGNYYHDCRPC